MPGIRYIVSYVCLNQNCRAVATGYLDVEPQRIQMCEACGQPTIFLCGRKWIQIYFEIRSSNLLT